MVTDQTKVSRVWSLIRQRFQGYGHWSDKGFRGMVTDQTKGFRVWSLIRLRFLGYGY